jgi:hypothetical protein
MLVSHERHLPSHPQAGREHGEADGINLKQNQHASSSVELTLDDLDDLLKP